MCQNNQMNFVRKKVLAHSVTLSKSLPSHISLFNPGPYKSLFSFYRNWSRITKKYKRWKRRRMAAYIRVAVSAPQYHRKREGRKELIIGAQWPLREHAAAECHSSLFSFMFWATCKFLCFFFLMSMWPKNIKKIETSGTQDANMRVAPQSWCQITATQ